MLLNCILIAISCLGFYNATRYGNILYFIQRIAIKLPYNLGKPICLCMRCMASLHTLVIYPVFFGTDLLEILFAILIVSGLNSILERYAE